MPGREFSIAAQQPSHFQSNTLAWMLATFYIDRNG
jgi:hypothetical protein